MIYPGHVKLSEQEKTNICYLAFPDSNSGCMGDTQFHMRIRQAPGRHPLRPEHRAYNQKCPAYLQIQSGYFYGYVYFRQVKDKTIPRGYFQKVKLHIYRFFSKKNYYLYICNLIPAFFFLFLFSCRVLLSFHAYHLLACLPKSVF